jgi:hypothetical protein
VREGEDGQDGGDEKSQNDKEWWKSKSTESTINDLVELGVLHNQELAGWRPADGDSYPHPQPGEIVIFKDFF